MNITPRVIISSRFAHRILEVAGTLKIPRSTVSRGYWFESYWGYGEITDFSLKALTLTKDSAVASGFARAVHWALTSVAVLWPRVFYTFCTEE